VPTTVEGGAFFGVVLVTWAALTLPCGRVVRGVFFGARVAVVPITSDPVAVVVAAVVAVTDVVVDAAAVGAVVLTTALVVAAAVDVAAEVDVVVAAVVVAAVVVATVVVAAVVVDAVVQGQPVVVGGVLGVEHAQPPVGVVGAVTVGGFGGSGFAGTDKQATVHACSVAWSASAVAA
jgi:hypothetical protein